MQIEKEKEKKPRVIGWPNELTDGKPGSFHQSELFKWIPDDNCHGLYCQKYPEPYLFRLFDKLDRDADRREAAKAVQSFTDEQLAPRPLNQQQIEARIAKRPLNHIRACWIDEAGTTNHFPEVPLLPWWKKFRSITIKYRYKLEEIARKQAEKKHREFVLDHPISEEIVRGDWD